MADVEPFAVLAAATLDVFRTLVDFALLDAWQDIQLRFFM